MGTRALLVIAVLGLVVGYLILGSGLISIGEKDVSQPAPTAQVAGDSGGKTVSPGASPSPQSTPLPPATFTPAPTPAPVLSTEGLALEPEPVLILNPPSLLGTGSVTVTGQGFPSREGIVVTLDGQPLNLGIDGYSLISDKTGNFSGLSIEVPASMQRGQHVVQAVSAKTGKTAEARFDAMPGGAWIEPSTYAAKPGDSVHFKGGGFSPGETVKVFFDRLGHDAMATVEAGPTGDISADVGVPLSGADQHAFIFVGESSGFPARVGFSVLGFYPWVVLTTYVTPPERAIGFAGYDFVPGETISVYLNEPGVRTIGSFRANSKGSFQLSNAFHVPAKLVGENTLYFVGQESNTTISAPFEVSSFAPILELTSYAGQPGTRVAFSGSGYAANETLRAYLGQTAQGQEVANLQADQNGSFVEAGEFTVPVGSPSGSLDITLVGDTSQQPVTISFKVLQLNVWADLRPYSGGPGADVYVSGHSFASNERVAVYVGSTQGTPAMIVSADQKGDFLEAGPFIIPSDATGKVPITLIGQQSKSEATASFTVLEEYGEGQGEGAPQGGTSTPQPAPAR